MPIRHIVALALLALAAPALRAQDSLSTYAEAFEARLHRTQPRLAYTVRVDPADLSGWNVELEVRNAPDTLRLALPVWAPGAYRLVDFARNVRDLTVSSGGQAMPVTREDSSSWRAPTRGGRATVRWRIVYPNAAAGETPNNRSFLRATGGLVDGPATFLYLVGRKNLPAHLTLRLPEGWRVATGLVPTMDPRVFFAPSYDILIDSPILLGALREWRFEVEGVPHRVAYWPRPDAPAFDTAVFVRTARDAVAQAVRIAGTVPYRDYSFLFVDADGGGLEHLNSTTIGVTSADLAQDARAAADVTAHEFFHLWNVKRLRPAALGPFDYQHPVRTTSLWWSEGVTDWFGAEIVRRAGLSDEADARSRLEGDLAAYFGNPAHARISPERSSWSEWDGPAANEGYYISYYLQGALLGGLLELELRDRTDAARGMDDVLRLMMDRHAGARGFGEEDIVRAVNDVCGCDLQAFFARHVSGAEPFPVARTLALAGWRVQVDTAPALAADGTAAPDLRLGATSFAGIGSRGGAAGGRVRLSVGSPLSVWGRAGLLSGDELVAIDGRPVATPEALRRVLAAKHIGDRVRVDYLRAGIARSATVTIAGYRAVKVRITDLPTVTPKMRAVRRAWMVGEALR